LCSNLPTLRNPPYRLDLTSGVVFRDAPAPDAEFHRPLLGMRVLLRAGVKVKIDFAKATVSLWTPERSMVAKPRSLPAQNPEWLRQAAAALVRQIPAVRVSLAVRTEYFSKSATPWAK
jgi:hypothetical protein